MKNGEMVNRIYCFDELKSVKMIIGDNWSVVKN